MMNGIWPLRLAYSGRYGTPRAVNVYFVVGEGNALLIDTGMAEHVDAIEHGWRQLGCPRIQAIVLTHGHPDHAGGVVELQRRWQVPVWVHHLEEPVLQIYAPELTAYGYLEDGEELQTPIGQWETLWVPGHTPGQLNFFDRNAQTLLSGDNVLTDTTTLVAGPHADLDAYFNSLERLLRLPVQRLVPGHGAILDQNGWQRIADIWKIRVRRDGELLGLISAGISQPDALAIHLYGPDERDPRHIMGKEMILSHIAHLQRQGLIVLNGSDWQLGSIYGTSMPKGG